MVTPQMSLRAVTLLRDLEQLTVTQEVKPGAGGGIGGGGLCTSAQCGGKFLKHLGLSKHPFNHVQEG